MFFDFFSLKIKAESKATDEAFLGYFFGKTNETIEYRFICFPRRFSNQIVIDLNLPLANFRESLNNFYLDIANHSVEVSEMTGEFMRYLHNQIDKLGGREGIAIRLSKIIQNNEVDIIRFEVNEIFKNWTSSLDLELVVETSTYEELTNSFLGDVDNGLFLDSLRTRDDIMSLPEIYPIVDPLEGVSIDQFDIGDMIYCTILGFTDEDSQRKLLDEYPGHFDAENKNIIPLEAIIVSKEIMPSVSKNFVLIKVQIGSFFVAKSIVLRSIRLMYDPEKMKKRLNTLKSEAASDSLSLAEVMSKNRRIQAGMNKTITEKKSSGFGDFFLTTLLLLMVTGLIVILVYFFLLT